MEDQHRKPSEGERNALRDRIKRAAADGRISQADADIRLGNVGRAQSVLELGLLARELDQVEATLSAGSAVTPTSAAASDAGSWSPSPVPSAGGGSGRVVPLAILGVVVALVVAGAISLFVVTSDDDAKEATGTSQSGPELPQPQAPGVSPAIDPEGPVSPGQPEEPGKPAGAGDPFRLTAEGIREFLRVYRAKFGTTRATDATLYQDYVIVQVPVPGKKRHAGWLYRDGEWREFGGISADFPGTRPIDLAELDIAALMRNIGKARRTLNVEDISTTYVVMNFRPAFDQAPNVNIYVSNEYRESGYLATTLDGKVERAYPFTS